MCIFLTILDPMVKAPELILSACLINPAVLFMCFQCRIGGSGFLDVMMLCKKSFYNLVEMLVIDPRSNLSKIDRNFQYFQFVSQSVVHFYFHFQCTKLLPNLPFILLECHLFGNPIECAPIYIPDLCASWHVT